MPASPALAAAPAKLIDSVVETASKSEGAVAEPARAAVTESCCFGHPRRSLFGQDAWHEKGQAQDESEGVEQKNHLEPSKAPLHRDELLP